MLKWIGALIAAALLAACNPVAQAEDARAEVDRFHEMLNAEQDDAIWNRASEELQSASSKDEFEQLMQTVRRTLGKAEETSQVGVRMNTNMQGSFTSVQMETHFERGRAMETFVFKTVDDQLRLVNYNINSEDMMNALMEGAAEAEGEEPTEPEAEGGPAPITVGEPQA